MSAPRLDWSAHEKEAAKLDTPDFNANEYWRTLPRMLFTCAAGHRHRVAKTEKGGFKKQIVRYKHRRPYGECPWGVRPGAKVE